MAELTRAGDVFVLNLGDSENRLHPDWLSGVHKALDEVEAAEGPRALVTTATRPRSLRPLVSANCR